MGVFVSLGNPTSSLLVLTYFWFGDQVWEDLLLDALSTDSAGAQTRLGGTHGERGIVRVTIFSIFMVLEWKLLVFSLK